MYHRFASLLFLAASTLSMPAWGKALTPVENWVVDYREDQCLATRRYGDLAKPVTLAVRPAPNGETYELLLSKPGSASTAAAEAKGAVDFGGGEIKAWLLSYGTKGSQSKVYQFRIPAAEMAQAASATTVTLRPEGEAPVTFSLSSMKALLDTLRVCTADLQKYWNADGERLGAIATPSKGDVRGVFTANDYPADAIYRNQGGTSQFLLLIDEKGSVAGCHVQKASGIPVLDAMGCQVIRLRSKFSPARDRSGKPVRSTVVTPPIVWRME